MSYNHNHHTAHNYDPGYPPEYDDPEICQVCGGIVDDTCDCPECKVVRVPQAMEVPRPCCAVGDPECYAKGHMKPMHDSIQSLIDHEGCGTTLGENFHAIERHSSPGYALWIVLRAGTRYGSCVGSGVEYTGEIVEVDPDEFLPAMRRTRSAAELVDKLPTYTRIHKVGISGIAWDGSD